jgi:hypothetical protein
VSVPSLSWQKHHFVRENPRNTRCFRRQAR